jgi:triphosphoribosyl-dephospho-CoA synthase
VSNALARTQHLARVLPPGSIGSVKRDARAIAAYAVDCLLLELETYPKPGLVSHMDRGSHTDMDADTLRRGATALGPYLCALAEAGAQNSDMGRLRVIGVEAEAAMLEATAGVNTHRGAIFGLGLLCAAAGARLSGTVESTAPLGSIVARRWGKEILRGPVTLRSHGLEARRRYGAGGARCQAADGFPGVYGVGIPALKQAATMAPTDADAVLVHACFSLIAAVEDTNLLHRGGTAGLCFAQSAARSFLDRGGVGQLDWRVRARTVHEAFVQRRLSPGGSADLLAMSLFVQAIEQTGADVARPQKQSQSASRARQSASSLWRSRPSCSPE